MTQPVEAFQWATVVAGPDPIPTEWQVHLGDEIGLPQDVMLAIPSDPNNPVRIKEYMGYRRAGPGGSTEIVLTPPVPVTVRNAITNMPIPQQWGAGEEAKVQTVAQTLIYSYSVPPTVARDAIQQVFNSARTVS